MRPLEARTLRALLAKESWSSLQDVVTATTFKDMHARKLFNIVSQLHDVVDGDIDPSAVQDAVETTYHIRVDMMQKLLKEWGDVESTPVPDTSAVRQTIAALVRKGKALEAAEHIATQVDNIDFDPTPALRLLEEASDMVDSLDACVCDYGNAPAPGMDDRKGLVGLGLDPELDRALGGGLANGELLLFFGASGKGKTSNLVHLGKYHASLGLTVLHISCEDHENKIRQRYDCALTGMDKDQLLEHPELVMKQRKAMPGRILIQDWSDRDVRASMVRSLVKRLEKSKGYKIDTVIVDYIGKMASDVKLWEGARPYAKITDQLRRVCSELNVKGASGWQANDDGAKAILLERTHLADDKAVYRECDSMITLNMTDEEMKEKRCRFGVLKSRDSTYRPVKLMHVDLDRMKFMTMKQVEERDHDTKELGDSDPQ
jgi:replicative DNA helicase